MALRVMVLDEDTGEYLCEARVDIRPAGPSGQSRARVVAWGNIDQGDLSEILPEKVDEARRRQAREKDEAQQTGSCGG